METQRHREHRESFIEDSVSSVPLCFVICEALRIQQCQLQLAKLLPKVNPVPLFDVQEARPTLG